MLGQEFQIVVNGWSVGTAKTAMAVPTLGNRFGSDGGKERRVYDGTIPIVSFEVGNTTNFEQNWFSMKGSDLVGANGVNYLSFAEAVKKSGTNLDILFWVDHRYLHCLSHKGDEQPVGTETENISQQHVYQAGCEGCERAKMVCEQQKDSRSKSEKKNLISCVDVASGLKREKDAESNKRCRENTVKEKEITEAIMKEVSAQHPNLSYWQIVDQATTKMFQNVGSKKRREK